jgi:hypothetical protein
MLVLKRHVKKVRELAAQNNVEGVKKPSIVSQKPHTMVTIVHNDKIYYGFSKCAKKTRWNPDVGFSIAVERAIRSIKGEL